MDDEQNRAVMEKAFWGLADHVRALATRTGREPLDVLDQLQTMFLRQARGREANVRLAVLRERGELRG